MLLENRIAIVTGGAQGIGAATASLLRSEGALVEVWDAAAGHPETGKDEGLTSHRVDVSDTSGVEAALEERAGLNGGLHGPDRTRSLILDATTGRLTGSLSLHPGANTASIGPDGAFTTPGLRHDRPRRRVARHGSHCRG